jgi:hypothetical protein
MSLPIDIAARVSPELSAIIDDLVNDPGIEEAVTLGVVRRKVASRVLGKSEQVEQLHAAGRQTVLAEIDALIAQCTDKAPAADFVAAKASEQLSRVIEALMNNPNTPQRPTLGAVREALTRGIAARLVGEGAIDPDEDETLLAEIDELIVRFGPAAPAEQFMRYE